MPSSSAATAADGARLAARVAELERERTHLLAVIEILKEVSTSLHFIDILQAIARKLGEAFGLDRSEEHTSELQSQSNLVCRLLLEKKKKNKIHKTSRENVYYRH